MRGRFLVTFGVLVMLPLSTVSAQGQRAGKWEKLLRDAKQELAPDRRTVVFNVKAKQRGETLALTGEVHSAELKAQLVELMSRRTRLRIVDKLVALPDTSVRGREHAVVSVSVANIRSRPSHAAEMATQAILGTPMRVLREEHGWYYVQTPDEYLGWTDDRIAFMNEEALKRWSERPKLIVTKEVGFSHQSEEESSPVVSDLVVGSILGLLRETPQGYQVDYPDGRVAFVSRDIGQPYAMWVGQSKETPENIVKTAYRFFGVPYLWGGTSVKGMDCSGFTKTVYYLNGVLLPRDASQQAAIGEQVDTSDAFRHVRGGDLLFFGFKAKRNKPERITHVGISLGGRRFIHCSTDVHVNSLEPSDADYSQLRSETFLHVRRIIGAATTSGVRRLATIPYYRGDGP